MPEWARTNPGMVKVLGGKGDIVVLKVFDKESTEWYGPGRTTVLAVNLRDRRTIWQQDFDGSTVVDGVVVGVVKDNGDKTRLKALDITTGDTRWTTENAEYKATVAAAGPHLLLHTRPSMRFLSQPTSSLIDVRTGKVAKDIEGHFGGKCEYDGQANTVCWTIDAPSDGVLAVDATTGDVRWQLPDSAANRIAPKVTSVYKGRIYGTTRDSGPIALDSRTGADVKTSPGLGSLFRII